MNFNLVSIIIPVFNKEASLKSTFNSILKQTYENFEVIIIDDGSTDESLKIIKEFTVIDSRFKVYTQNNFGVSQARNVGIRMAKGSYISFLDADDIYKEDYLESMLKSMHGNNISYCGHIDYYVKDDKKITQKIKFKDGDIIVDYLKGRTTPNTNSWMIKKDFIIKHNVFFDESLNWGEDMLFFGSLLVLGNKVKSTKQHLTLYNRDPDNSLSYKSFDKIQKDILWMEKLEKFTHENVVNSKRKLVYRAMKNYRKPAAIIYGIIANLDDNNKVEAAQFYEKNKKQLKFNPFYNGLKTMKLFVYKLILINKLRGEL